MESLAKNRTTPGVDAAARLVASLPEDPERAERYPNGTVFIASDLPDAGRTFERAIREKRPVALVFPDGSDVVSRPPSGNAVALFLLAAITFLAVRASGRREAVLVGDEPLYFPPSWATEAHPAPAPPALVSS
jgi:hypothetical protein